MKVLFSSILLIFSLGFVKAQLNSDNRFQDSEDVATGTTKDGHSDGLTKKDGNPPGPGDEDVPIDKQIPALAILGSILIIYKYRYKILKIN